MSLTSTNLIQERIEEVALGEPTIHGQMAVFPILGEEEGTADYITLDEAISNGYARVTEIDKEGNVPELNFKNECEKRIFLMEGEELVGAKQNRTLNLSIMVPAGKEITVPVTCVESGRWSYDSDRFHTSNRVHFAKGRRNKTASVSHSMRVDDMPHADQGEVWARISEKARKMKSYSRTSAMGDIFEDHGKSIEDYVKAFIPVEDQAGMLVLVSNDIAGLDLFDKTKTLKKLMPKLIRSFALDAIERNTKKPYQPNIADAKDLLAKSAVANISAYPGVGEGENIRLQSEEVVGGALAIDNKIIHLSVFKSENHYRDQGSRVRRASHRRSHKNRNYYI